MNMNMSPLCPTHAMKTNAHLCSETKYICSNHVNVGNAFCPICTGQNGMRTMSGALNSAMCTGINVSDTSPKHKFMCAVRKSAVHHSESEDVSSSSLSLGTSRLSPSK